MYCETDREDISNAHAANTTELCMQWNREELGVWGGGWLFDTEKNIENDQTRAQTDCLKNCSLTLYKWL